MCAGESLIAGIAVCCLAMVTAKLRFLTMLVAGFRVGRQLAERYTANRARLGEPLEVIKFICKEFWADVFRKQVTVLRCYMRPDYLAL